MQIDFHSHILPECDHGSRDIDTSLSQLKLAAESGVDVICATSHFYPDKEGVEDFLLRRKKSAEVLKNALDGAGTDRPRLLLGAEVLVCEGMEKMNDIEKLCLEGTDILLVELPFSDISDRLEETLSELGDHRIVLAHVDRYDKTVIDRLLSMGLYAQINADALSRMFVTGVFKKWIEQGSVVAFGSDIHGTDIGYKNWSKARKRLGSLWDSVMERTEELIK